MDNAELRGLLAECLALNPSVSGDMEKCRVWANVVRRMKNAAKPPQHTEKRDEKDVKATELERFDKWSSGFYPDENDLWHITEYLKNFPGRTAPLLAELMAVVRDHQGSNDDRRQRTTEADRDEGSSPAETP